MKYINEVNLKNKTIILRVDYNVPLKDGKVSDDFRILSSTQTINYLLDNNCKIIMLSHLGKVKAEEDKNKNNMQIVYKRLKQIMNCKIHFCPVTDGDLLDQMVTKLKNKEILLIQNTRYEDLNNKRESNCDESLSKYWASLGDIFVMDAFGACHREHASTYGISRFLPTCYGFLIQKEKEILDEVINNDDKVLILGGAKVSDKIDLIDNLIVKSKKIIVGGKMSLTFLKVLGNNIDKSQIEEDKLEYAKKLLSKNKEKIVLPIDMVNENKENKLLKDINAQDKLLDIGKKTLELFKDNLNRNSLVVWNGPMGYIEDKKFETGTLELLKNLNNYDIKTIIAGGDTANIVNKYNFNFYHISTGGGATLEYLEGKNLRSLEGEYYETDIIE